MTSVSKINIWILNAEISKLLFKWAFRPVNFTNADFYRTMMFYLPSHQVVKTIGLCNALVQKRAVSTRKLAQLLGFLDSNMAGFASFQTVSIFSDTITSPEQRLLRRPRKIQPKLIKLHLVDRDKDLFATRLTHQLPHYVSWHPDSKAIAADAFWASLRGYAFPSKHVT